MNNPSTVEQLREMRFSAMANEFDAQLKAPATYAQIPFEDRFGLLVNAEWNRRQANKLAWRIRDAHLDIPSATMEGIEYHEDRKLDRAQLIRFATCNYIEEEHHVILKGATGPILPAPWGMLPARNLRPSVMSGCRGSWMS